MTRLATEPFVLDHAGSGGGGVEVYTKATAPDPSSLAVGTVISVSDGPSGAKIIYVGSDGYYHRISDDSRVAFNVDDIAGLEALWAARLQTGLSDSGPVSTYEDASPNNLDAVQATAGLKPLWKSSGAGPNSLPFLQFDETDDYLQYTPIDPNKNGGHTVFAVCYWPNYMDTARDIISQHGPSNLNWELGLSENGQRTVKQWYGGFNNQVQLPEGWCLITYAYRTGVGGGTDWVKRNGVEVSRQGAAATDPHNSPVGRLGRNAYSSSWPAMPKVAEIRYYSGLRTDDEIALVEDNIKTLYGF